MNFKRVTLLCGHYGSGKTNVSVNIALDIKKRNDKVILADLDIVNPYFRAKDSSELLSENGIRLVCSEYANTNVDFPALPQDIYTITDDKSYKAVIDVGGDDRGALALGRIAPSIVSENDYDMLMVINGYRPLTPDANSTMEVFSEIENACGIRFTGIVNNSNLGVETTAETVLKSVSYAESISEISKLPIVMTTVKDSLYLELDGRIPNLFPLTLRKNII